MTPGSDYRLHVAGGVLALGAGYLFFRNVFFSLSITVRAGLVLAVALLMLCWAAGPGPSRELPVLCMFTAIVVLLAYSVVQFRLPASLLLGLVPALVVGMVVLAYLVQEGWLAVGRSTAAYTALAIVLVSAAFVGIDLQIGGVEYTATLEDPVTLGDDSEGWVQVELGTATARNTFVFREPVSFPDSQACIYTGVERRDNGVFYRANGAIFHESVAGNGQLETRMTLQVPPEVARAVSDPLPVEHAETCPPADDGPPRIVVRNVPPAPEGETG